MCQLMGQDNRWVMMGDVPWWVIYHGGWCTMVGGWWVMYHGGWCTMVGDVPWWVDGGWCTMVGDVPWWWVFYELDVWSISVISCSQIMSTCHMLWTVYVLVMKFMWVFSIGIHLTLFHITHSAEKLLLRVASPHPPPPTPINSSNIDPCTDG